MPRGFAYVSFALFAMAGEAAERVTLAEALRIADAQHPQLQAGSAGVDAARAGITTARAYPNPQFDFMTGQQWGQPPGGRVFNVPFYSFVQPLEFGRLRPSRIRLAERGQESSEFFLGGVRLAVLSHVRRTFFEVLRHSGEIEISNDNLRLVQELRNRIQVRVDVGEAGRLELVRADAEVVTARTLVSSARLVLVNALAQFRAAVGGRLPQDVELTGALDPPAVLPPLQEVRQQALDRHPALALARSEVTRAEARLHYETALKRPQPFLRTEVDMTNPSYRFGFGVVLPAWNQRRGPIAEAEAARRQASSLAQARQIEIIAELEGAYERYQVATQQIAQFEEGLLLEAAEALRAAETAYQLGERGILEVLDAQRVLRTVRLGFLNAQYDRQAALIDLDELRAVDLRSNTP
jgi:cobalt-zinc-cadmium efflux system outer membrane protein